MEEKKLTPMQAIRAKCLDCCFTANEVKLCTFVNCSLYKFRFGKNPNYSQETREKRKQLALKSNLGKKTKD